VPERLIKQRSDPWKDFLSTKQSITAAIRKKIAF
jgi:hypothetical protein